MSSEKISTPVSNTGTDAVDAVIIQGVDLDGSPIPVAKLALDHKVMALESQRQRNGVRIPCENALCVLGQSIFPRKS